jgi:hypothetical protein
VPQKKKQKNQKRRPTHEPIVDDYAPYKMRMSVETEDGVPWFNRSSTQKRILFGYTTGYQAVAVVKNPDNGMLYRVNVTVALLQQQESESAELKAFEDWKARMARKRK